LKPRGIPIAIGPGAAGVVLGPGLWDAIAFVPDAGDGRFVPGLADASTTGPLVEWVPVANEGGTLVSASIGFVGEVELVSICASVFGGAAFVLVASAAGAALVEIDGEGLFEPFPAGTDGIAGMAGPGPGWLTVSGGSDGNSGTVTCASGLSRIPIWTS